jgi:FtsZ-binding cell division protein ZapB
MISTSKVITSAERTQRPRTIQPGNREWVTIVEAVNATGWALPPLIIFAGKQQQASGHQNPAIPAEWAIAMSQNGWTTDEIGMIWLEKVFNKYTKERTKGTYRLLVLDGHSSHLSAEFDYYCTENKIIPVCMPAHSSHLLQPLDVGCFSPLKKHYGKLIENLMKNGLNHIDKADFLDIYPTARQSAITSKNIVSGFAATGLVPFNPDQVLSQLPPRVRTPTPIPASSPYMPATPHTIPQIQRHQKAIRKLQKRRTASPPTPTQVAINQLAKGCTIAIETITLLQSEVERLRTENKRQMQKKARKKAAIGTDQVLTVSEARDRITQSDNADEQARTQIMDQSRKRAPPRCSGCGVVGHTIRNCPSK